MKNIIPQILSASLITLVANVSSAQETATKPFYEWDRLTGDWGGYRTELENSGVNVFAFYDAIVAGNVSGGIDTDQDYAGQFYAGLDFDFDKLFGWENTMMKASMVNRHGDSISPSIGGIYDPMTIYGGQVTYLYQLFIDTEIIDDLYLKFGRISADTDFVNNELYRYSLSTSINGPMRPTLLENSITSFPYSVWGGRLKYNLSEEHQFQLGVSQTGPDQWDFTNNGLDWSWGDDDGVSVLLQYDWKSELWGCPTHVFVGAISSFREFNNFTGGTTDFLFRPYIHVDMEVFEDMTVFGFATYSPEDEVALTPLQLSLGFNYRGMIPGREDDRTVGFISYGDLSHQYGDSIGEDVSFEMVYELGYRVQVTPAFYLQPSIQYVMNPGGTGNIEDAVILGAWIGAAF